MEKNKITVEHLLNSTSKNIIWQLIGTDSGLQKWIADSVTLDGDQLTCTWAMPTATMKCAGLRSACSKSSVAYAGRGTTRPTARM